VADELARLKQQRQAVEAEIQKLKGTPRALPGLPAPALPASFPAPAQRRLGWGAWVLLGLGGLGIAYAATKSRRRR
jgi:ferric-dicitrate binding protein FerR (iron transport regulator)